MSLNLCQFIGHVGKDPEIKSTQSGTRVANFSLAVTEKWKDKSGERREKTEWVSVVVWSDGLIGIIGKYVHKGSKLYVSGKMQTRKWEKDGVDRYTTECVLQGFDGRIELLGEPKDASTRDDTASKTTRGYAAASGGGYDDDDPIPF
jgi:single-strand DNA-binding protein